MSFASAIGSGLDRLIGIVAPTSALRRSAHRAALDNLQRLQALVGYAGGKRDRTTRDFNPRPDSADSALLASREMLNARARVLVRDTPHGAAVRRAFKRNVVGLGISPAPCVKAADGKTILTEWNDLARRLFNHWAGRPRFCDVERRQSFWAKQRMAIGEFAEVGEHFIVCSYQRNPEAVGLRLQSFEPEQLDTTGFKVETGNDVKAGIEVDENGAPVAYWFRRHHPFDTSGSLTPASLRGSQSIRVPAEQVFHVYEQDRVRQSHGVTRLASGIQKLRGVGAYDEATIMAARLEACIGLIITRTGGTPGFSGLAGSGLSEDDTDADGNRQVNFQPGMVFNANPGESVQAHAPTRPGGGYEPFMSQQLRHLGAGTGVGFGPVTLDYTKGTYSGQRQEMLEVRPEYEVLEQLMVEQFCDPLWAVFIAFAILEGRLPAPTIADFMADPAPWLACEWEGPARPWIDPEKEMKANALGLVLGVQTRERILNELGFNVRDTFTQLAAEQKLADELGIKITQQPAMAPAPGTDGDPGDDTDPDDPNAPGEPAEEPEEALAS